MTDTESYGDEDLVEFIIGEYSDTSESGTEHIRVDGVGFWVKFIKIEDREDYTGAKRELDINKEFTEYIPDYVSKLVAAKLTFDEEDDEDQGGLYLVFEPLNGMDLLNYVNTEQGPAGVRPEIARAIYCSAQTAINKLHELGYAHRDIKPENIFVELNANRTFKTCKLIDFGTAIRLGNINSNSGTEGYIQIDRPLRVTHMRNQYSLDKIWSIALRQAGPVPTDCIVAEGGRRRRGKAATKKLKKLKKRRATRRHK